MRIVSMATTPRKGKKATRCRPSQSWFQKRLKKSVKENREILEALD